MCWFGCDQVEDEYHFLVSCQIYSDLRQCVIDKVGTPAFELSGLEIMMGTKNLELTEFVIVFIQRALHRRSLLVSQIE